MTAYFDFGHPVLVVGSVIEITNAQGVKKLVRVVRMEEPVEDMHARFWKYAEEMKMPEKVAHAPKKHTEPYYRRFERKRRPR